MVSHAERLPAPPAGILDLLRRRSNVVMFAAGFLFDLVTIRRIDAWTDLSIQVFYLASLTLMLIHQHREAAGQWKPPAKMERLWAYNVEVLHFFYGGLLSAYVVLYLKSSTRARPLVFFVLLVALMVFNEMPQVRRAGYRLRLGLYAFCVFSFLNYFVPILIGRMSGGVFLLALGASAGVVWLVAGRLAVKEADPRTIRVRLFMPALAVCAVIGGLYVFRLIPPVPLSVQFQGIYHDVRREGNSFVLTYEKPPLHLFWRRDSRPFRKGPGDRLHYFVRVFAPTRFRHEVYARWEHKGAGGWSTRDRIRLPVAGGRSEGYRAYAVKSNFEPGRWRVTAETEDGRAMASLTFTVEESQAATERTWRTIGG
ncbi:MAG TPA: DUF2914 domain-containing protein [Candidatus Polarisedimenticolia bacterium]|nr:DUF2914 domain-containing protein [Candidatus Polarisedimenticolia bacterium]